jgi:hypothetical protein
MASRDIFCLIVIILTFFFIIRKNDLMKETFISWYHSDNNVYKNRGYWWYYHHYRRHFQSMYPDLNKERFIGLLVHDSSTQDEGYNSWYVYATRRFDVIRYSQQHYDFDVFWRDIYIIPSNTRYRGEIYKYGYGEDDNRIGVTLDTLDMYLDLKYLKEMPAQLRFRHSALHDTPYTFISFEK